MSYTMLPTIRTKLRTPNLFKCALYIGDHQNFLSSTGNWASSLQMGCGNVTCIVRDCTQKNPSSLCCYSFGSSRQ